MRWKVREVSQTQERFADPAIELGHFVVGALKKFFEQAQFVHEFESGGVNGVAPEIAKKIGVFFENHDIDASAGQEVAEHHAGWAATDDAATSIQPLHICSPSVHL